MVVMAVRAMVKAMTRAAVEMGSGGSAGVVDVALERGRHAWRVATMAWVRVALVAVVLVVVAWVVAVAEERVRVPKEEPGQVAVAVARAAAARVAAARAVVARRVARAGEEVS